MHCKLELLQVNRTFFILNGFFTKLFYFVHKLIKIFFELFKTRIEIVVAYFLVKKLEQQLCNCNYSWHAIIFKKNLQPKYKVFCVVSMTDVSTKLYLAIEAGKIYRQSRLAYGNLNASSKPFLKMVFPMWLQNVSHL